MDNRSLFHALRPTPHNPLVQKEKHTGQEANQTKGGVSNGGKARLTSTTQSVTHSCARHASCSMYRSTPGGLYPGSHTFRGS